MSLNAVTPGNKAPHEVNVVIEIAANSGPVKYEVDKDSGALMVDRFLGTSMTYPANYGYVPCTLSDDGDPVDVLVLTSAAIVPGSVIKVRPIGMLQMTDESGEDAKVLAVPVSKLDPSYDNIQSTKDLPQQILDRIAHFFEHYKDLEAGKWVKIGDWKDVASAHHEIEQSIERFS